METAQPDLDGYLIKLDDLPLEQILWNQDSVLADAVRRVIRTAQSQPHESVAAFGNAV